MVLLAVAGLTLKSFWRSQNAPLGFEPDGILTMTLSLPQARYDSNEKVVAFYQQLIQRIEALPGVSPRLRSAKMCRSITRNGIAPSISPGTPPALPGQEPSAEVNVVSAGLLQGSARCRFCAGAALAPKIGLTSPARSSSMTCSRARYFPGKNPVGQHLDDNQTNDKTPPPLTIVGVVPRVRSDVPGEEFDLQNLPQMYFYAAQFARYENSLLVRVKSGDPASSPPAVVREVQSIDPDQPVANISSMRKNISESLATRRLTMTLLGAFAALALVLASVGLYGVMALSVTQRTREFGIRLALGAPRPMSFGSRSGAACCSSGSGSALGLLGAMGAGRALTSLLYDTGGLDPARSAHRDRLPRVGRGPGLLVPRPPRHPGRSDCRTALRMRAPLHGRWGETLSSQGWDNFCQSDILPRLDRVSPYHRSSAI